MARPRMRAATWMTFRTTRGLLRLSSFEPIRLRFRLKVVSMFGSMASGLYEFGADPETGRPGVGSARAPGARISQRDFVRVCARQLDMMSEREATWGVSLGQDTW